MNKLSVNNGWPLVRFIVPAFPEVNIFTRAARKMTQLGLVMVATAANKLWGWRVEIIDENNYIGPRDLNGLPDHKKLQQDNPATVVGFYCGLTSTMDRVYELISFYKNAGTLILAGGWHAHYCPEEVIEMGANVVVHGDGEIAIKQILTQLVERENINSVPGTSFKENGKIVKTPPLMLEIADLSDLPYPDFGLLKFARKIKTYPIGHVRGCGMNCEFCSVKGEPRYSSPEYVFGVINWLVETRNAEQFFFVDDRLEEDKKGLIHLLELIRDKHGNRLYFTVQVRLEVARDIKLLELMKSAGVGSVCVGYESPIDEDLRAMHKGILARNMVEWTKVLRRYFWVHGMFIFGYPTGLKNTLGVKEMIGRYKSFIKEAEISTIQVMHPLPLMGTELRARLVRENRVFPWEVAPRKKYDGNSACFMPDNMTLKEFQEAPLQIMKWFYSSWSFWGIPFRTISFPIHFLVKGWHHWHHGWLTEIVKYGGHRLIKQWQKRHGNRTYLSSLESYRKKIAHM